MIEKNLLLEKFISTVNVKFKNLLRENDFSISEEEIFSPRYARLIFKNRRALLIISFDTYSYEIELQVGEYSDQDESKNQLYSLGDLIRYFHAENEINFLAPQASTESGVEKVLLIIESFLREKALLFLQGDRSIYLQLKEFLSVSTSDDLIKVKLGPVKEASSLAWKNNDYTRFVELLGPVEEYLTDTEKKKLGFARKHEKS